MLRNAADDDVGGTVIGDVSIPGALFYDGRRQSQTFWASDAQALKQRAEARVAELKAQTGEAYRLIYPEPSKWELRIYD